jgi:3-oxosteroid 1-dehydrogenase
VATAQGDFVKIARENGAELAQMRNGWFYTDLFEKAALDPLCLEGGIPAAPGDSMIYVDRNGRRVVNEKCLSQERAAVHWDRDEAGDYTNRVLFVVYDHFVVTDERPWFSSFGGAFRPSNPWVIVGDSFEDLSANVTERLESHERVVGDLRLSASFASELANTIERFNSFAREGKDEDFQRGETLAELDWNGPARAGNEKNPTMYPFRGQGPYYCVLISGMLLDTGGGPKTNNKSEVLRTDGSVIKGLYGAGNCVAAVAGEGYFSAGSTLAPAAVFAYLAAKNVTQQTPRDLSAIRQALSA